MQELPIDNSKNVREMLSASGYDDKAIDYFMQKVYMGSLPDADQVSELTGPCGDTMKIFLKFNGEKIDDARIQVLGCPGAVASAMATMERIRGKTLDEAMEIKDGDIFKMLGDIPDQKQHCIRLTVKTLQKAIKEYRGESTGQKGE
jgi:nitrogen fixation NifU-like protein